MDEAKVRAVLEHVYNTAHYALVDAIGQPIQVSEPEYREALEDIESKIEELTDEDLGE